MKKNLFLLAAVACMAAGFTSCDDNDNHAEANCTYYVGTDSISYSDPLNAQYDSLIQNSFDSLGFTAYYFEEHAEVDVSWISNAIALCDSKAEKKYLNSMASPVTLQQVEERLYSDNKDFFNSKGISSAENINLQPMTIYTYLGSFTYNSIINRMSVRID